jgi:nucleoside-diphosphate-sugar epimerase
MKVLITGAAGFLGRHFTARLRADGHDVSGIDNAEPGAFDALDVFRYGQHRHYDLVIHCAAVSPHRAAIDGKALAVGAGNLALDAAMFEWAARTQPGRVVYFSSSAAYPTWLQDGFHEYRLTEDDIRKAHQPDAIYGEVKRIGERLADAYRQQGGAVTVLRPFSGYGEDQSADFPFGAFRDRATARQDPYTIWGDGTQVRDWIHVDDVVGGTLAAVERGVDGPLNLCTGVGTSMRDLARLFVIGAGFKTNYEFLSDRPSGVAYRVGDPTQMNEVYEPRISIEEGVRRALAQEVTDAADQSVLLGR